MYPVLGLPPRVRRLDDKHLFRLKRIPRLVVGDQNLVQLFAGPDPDVLDLAAWRNRFRQIEQAHAGNPGNKNLASVHLLQAADHEPHAMLEREPEARHTRIGDRDLAALALLDKNWNHTSPAADHVPIARAAEASLLQLRALWERGRQPGKRSEEH